MAENSLIKIFTSERIKLGEAIPHEEKRREEEQKENEQARKDVSEAMTQEVMRLEALYVKPHKKQGRWVKEGDVERVIRDGKDMLALCAMPRGNAKSAFAIAHTQIDDKDPLRFFVTLDGVAVINPMVIRHTNSEIEAEQGCMSYPGKEFKKTATYNKVTVVYQALTSLGDDKNPKLSKPFIDNLNGIGAKIFIHEICHLNGAYIYDEDYTPSKIDSLKDGKEMMEEEILKLYET